ncbi:RNA polymerase sigma factor [Chitinophaga solisilvae]|uniref:Sigma-70 family RNA polymerase sigma factor n=1 Tax=Chitinophaga solisilvae TaxID=1233460 RepID=A0A3S1CX31_9BACT|nr:sigma-70 family RNA polymerase sigma factor [Chitinophaga solisilvae]NSL90386.1 sigma-70 family RNA polymerase sigma factor [Chitinophaga solisilvae]
MNKTDAELVLLLQTSDVSAFDSLYWKYHQAVYRNILKFVKDGAAAEDILQEVFARLWEKRMEIQATQSVGGWLFVISFNLSVNYVRKKLREQALHKNLFNLDAEDQLVLDRKNMDEEQYNLLEQAIAQLSPKKRTIVTRCKLEGKTYDEVASELNISRNTVKEHLSAAMIKLNDYMLRNGDRRYIIILLIYFSYLNSSN